MYSKYIQFNNNINMKKQKNEILYMLLPNEKYNK